MLVQPAKKNVSRLLFRWWKDQPAANWGPYDALAKVEPVALFNRVLANPNLHLLVAGEFGEQLGLIIIERGRELRWTVSQRHRGKGFGKRMVELVAEPEHIARIRRDDIASRCIADYAGFDLIEDGDVQLWRGDRVERRV